jgi:cell division protein FtsQ
MNTMARAAASTVMNLPPELPFDVRLMNGVASGVFLLAAAALLAAGVLWLTRAPLFTIRSIQVDGDLNRNSISTIRANAMPQLKGNFFSLSLQKGRAAFEAVPWVRQAVVRRVWPNRLAVRLEEHHAAAIWQGEEGNDRLVNNFGEVFDANVGDVEEDGLPSFAGPDGTAAEMLSMYGKLQPVLRTLEQGIDTLRLSGRGSWRVELDGGAEIELGRGSEAEVLARCERFTRTLAQVTGRYRQPLEYADLRHADGYAVRLRGVTTKTLN